MTTEVGVWIWDESRNLIVDTSTFVSTLIGSTSTNAPFTVTDANFLKGTPWYFYYPRGVYSMTAGGGGTAGSGTPAVSFSGDTMTVTGSLFDGTFLYGIY